MNKPLKFSSCTHKLLWCSDIHAQHNPNWEGTPPLWKSRGFDSIGQHDEWVKRAWFEMVDDQTVVFTLGDHCFADPKGEWFRQFTTWPGRILAVNGNHWSGQRQIYYETLKAQYGLEAPLEVYPLTVNNLTFHGYQIHAFIDGTSVYMQHYAPLIWPEVGDGGLALVGHSHSRAECLNPEATTHGKVCDIGLDNAIRLTQTPFFTWAQVQEIMARKPVVTRDHH